MLGLAMHRFDSDDFHQWHPGAQWATNRHQLVLSRPASEDSRESSSPAAIASDTPQPLSAAQSLSQKEERQQHREQRIKSHRPPGAAKVLTSPAADPVSTA